MSQEQDDKTGVEVETPFGKLKTYGSSMGVQTVMILLALLGIYGLLALYWQHETNNMAARGVISASMKEQTVAMRESMKEQTTALREAVKEMVEVQKDAAGIAREQTCLIRFDPAQRSRMGDFCKQMGR